MEWEPARASKGRRYPCLRCGLPFAAALGRDSFRVLQWSWVRFFDLNWRTKMIICNQPGQRRVVANCRLLWLLSCIRLRSLGQYLSGSFDSLPTGELSTCPTEPANRAVSFFIVDNSDVDWKVLRYLHDWCQISRSIDVATGYFEIGSLLALKDEWQKVDNFRIPDGR